MPDAIAMTTLGRRHPGEGGDAEIRCGRLPMIVAGCAMAALLSLWASAALWLDGPARVAPLLAALFLFATGLLLVRVRPWPRAFAGWALLFALVLGWWLSLAPSNDRDWLADVEYAPTGFIDGDTLVMRNVRNFEYRSETDFTPNWEERRYDLSKLRGLDFFLVHWGSPYIAHTIVSWDFGGEYLAVSIETRKEQGESYSALRGFFRQYELYYVVADERDVIGVRASHRGEDVRLYRLRTPVETARAMLLDYVTVMNRLAERPKWYNALTHNCTTTIRMHTKQVAASGAWDFRFLANGTLDELGYERNNINTSLPFDEIRRLSNVTERAKAADGVGDFSLRIREGLPARP
jgi:hypothetical protein